MGTERLFSAPMRIVVARLRLTVPKHALGALMHDVKANKTMKSTPTAHKYLPPVVDLTRTTMAPAREQEVRCPEYLKRSELK